MSRMPRDKFKDKLVTWQLVFFAYGQIGMIQAAAGFFVYFMVLQRYLNEYGLDSGDLSGVGFSWKDETVPVLFGNCGSWLFNSGLVDDSRFGIGSKSVCGVPEPAGLDTSDLWDGEGNIKNAADLDKLQACDDQMSPTDDTQTTNLGPDYGLSMDDACTRRACTPAEIELVSNTKNNDVTEGSDIVRYCGYIPGYKWGYTSTTEFIQPIRDGAKPEEDGDPFPNFVLDHSTRVECLKKAQTSYLFSIIVVQWADVIICKTRVMSVLQHGMGNMVLNAGLFEETALGLAICYVPFMNAAFGGSGPHPRDMTWALPYSLFIWLYDETRKILMRMTGGKNREGCLYEYTYW